VQASSKSEISNVFFENTTFMRDGVLQLTGGVNFYESDVSFSEVVFNNSTAEDSLNIVRSTFSLNDVTFNRARSDAFDSDFSNGILESVTFKDVKGDGLDTSGSRITAKSLMFNNIGDKAISTGEASVVNAVSVAINGAGTGVVSKDSSTCVISDLNVQNIHGLVGMAYNKKPIYGAGTLKIKNTNASSGAFIAQHLSDITLNGKRLDTYHLNVDDLYSQGSMKKIR
jgi:hypothetical protein